MTTQHKIYNTVMVIGAGVSALVGEWILAGGFISAILLLSKVLKDNELPEYESAHPDPRRREIGKILDGWQQTKKISRHDYLRYCKLDLEVTGEDMKNNPRHEIAYRDYLQAVERAKREGLL